MQKYQFYTGRQFVTNVNKYFHSEQADFYFFFPICTWENLIYVKVPNELMTGLGL